MLSKPELRVLTLDTAWGRLHQGAFINSAAYKNKANPYSSILKEWMKLYVCPWRKLHSQIPFLWLKEALWSTLIFPILWSKTNNPRSVFLTANEWNKTPLGGLAVSVPVSAVVVFEVSCGKFITRILSRISEACWKLLMTDVSPLCHTSCIIWFGKQHTVFCSISMSQTVCKQLVITQFSENHYFPMKGWTPSKLHFGMALAA